MIKRIQKWFASKPNNYGYQLNRKLGRNPEAISECQGSFEELAAQEGLFSQLMQRQMA